MYVSGGGEKEWILTYNSSGFYRYKDGTWTNYNRMNGTSGMDSILDVMDIAVDPSNQYIYAASYGGGLLEIHPDNTHVLYRNTPYIQSQVGNPNGYIIAGLTMDRNNNLWLSNYAAIDQLVVKKKDGSWQKFSFPYSTSERAASQIVIDDANQKWLMAPRGIGIFVLNDNNTIDNKADDQIAKINKGSGLGNLPSNEVYCIEKDKDGKIWVGTADGIAIFNCPESIFSNNGCEAELKIVKYDLNAGLLFQREAVNTIAVDGANNKWIGTNNGVWLISDDAEKIIQRFTKDNSPLPTNEIRKIKVHPRTGEVFIATTMGLVSWRGNATDGAENNDQLLVFPNPVPADYAGTIAISGLVANADVRITDISGQLVYRTKAQGGQAVWNGKNYTGQKPRSGVYYVFVTNEDGSETKAGKFIFNE
jgi:ligand-binding sensor domain-containing protein